MNDVYIINKKFLFNSQEEVLYHIDDKSKTETLSLPLKNLLCYVISHNDETFTKESIAEVVLEKNNLSPSINNINNYLSLLRKSLRNFHINDAFMTILKVGIRFVADISSPSCEATIPPLTHKNKLYFIIIAIIIFSLLSYVFFYIFDKENYTNEYIVLYQDSSCAIFTKKPDVLYLENISSYCKYGNEIFFFHIKSPRNNLYMSDRYLIVSCQRGGVNCENHTQVY